MNWVPVLSPFHGRRNWGVTQTAQSHRAHDWLIWRANPVWIIPECTLVINLLKRLPRRQRLAPLKSPLFTLFSTFPLTSWHCTVPFTNCGVPCPRDICSFAVEEGQQGFNAYFVRSPDKFSSHTTFTFGLQMSFLWRPSKLHMPRLIVQAWKRAFVPAYRWRSQRPRWHDLGTEGEASQSPQQPSMSVAESGMESIGSRAVSISPGWWPNYWLALLLTKLYIVRSKLPNFLVGRMGSSRNMEILTYITQLFLFADILCYFSSHFYRTGREFGAGGSRAHKGTGLGLPNSCQLAHVAPMC